MPQPPTQFADCGTITAYNRHRRERESPCKPCREAKANEGTPGKAKKVTEKASKATSTLYTEALREEPEVEENLDRLAELRDALRGVRAAMASSSPMHIAGLSKERRELAKEIKELENALTETKEVDPLEELLKI